MIESLFCIAIIVLFACILTTPMSPRKGEIIKYIHSDGETYAGVVKSYANGFIMTECGRMISLNDLVNGKEES